MILQCIPIRSSNHEPTTDTQQQKLEMLIGQKSIISELFESDAIDVCYWLKNSLYLNCFYVHYLKLSSPNSS